MPVSLERLIAEVEPNVITEALTRECIQVRDAVVPTQLPLPWDAGRAHRGGTAPTSMPSNPEHALPAHDRRQVERSDPDAAANKKRTIPFREVECLAFSFRSLARIDNLRGLGSLAKLQLDNNEIKRIENLAHLASGVVERKACMQMVHRVAWVPQCRWCPPCAGVHPSGHLHLHPCLNDVTHVPEHANSQTAMR